MGKMEEEHLVGFVPFLFDLGHCFNNAIDF